MISLRACVYQVVEGLTQPMVPANERTHARRVFRASNRCLPQDPLEQRIVDLGDGRPTGEITETLYVEEIRAGPGSSTSPEVHF